MRTAFCTIAALGLGLAGCASEPRGPQPHVTDVQGVRFQQSTVLDATQPIALGARVGLEHHAWIADDTEGRVARVLGAYQFEPVPLDIGTLQRLRRSGFRVVAVPIEQVGDVHAAIPPRLTWQRDWAGQLITWTELLRGRTTGERQRLIIDGREMILPAGALRFIARAWAAPTPTGAVLRAEFGVQLHESARQDPAMALFDPTAALTLPEQGRLLRGVTFRADMPPTHALFIVGEPSSADWTGLTEPVEESVTLEADDETDNKQVDDAPAYEVLSESDVIDVDAFGPAAEGPQELGVFMLSGIDRSYTPIKAVFVLIPRVPEAYRLLP